MKRWMLFGLCGLLSVSALAQEEAVDPDPTAVAVPKKKIKKLTEYKDPEQAMQVAEALEQPVLAFIEVQGDKNCNKVRLGTVARQEFLKEFAPANVVYFHFVIPAVKEKPQGGRKPDKNAPAKPDLNALKIEVRAVISRFLGQNPYYPVMALVEPSGRVLDAGLAPDPEDMNLGSFVSSLKNAMEMGKYPVTITPRLQKAIDKEAKALEKAAKHKR